MSFFLFLLNLRSDTYQTEILPACPNLNLRLRITSENLSGSVCCYQVCTSCPAVDSEPMLLAEGWILSHKSVTAPTQCKNIVLHQNATASGSGHDLMNIRCIVQANGGNHGLTLWSFLQDALDKNPASHIDLLSFLRNWIDATTLHLHPQFPPLKRSHQGTSSLQATCHSSQSIGLTTAGKESKSVGGLPSRTQFSL